MDEELVQRVMAAIEAIPAGRVATYGDIAALVGTGPRQVGAILSTVGQDLPWWRVTNAQGELPAHLSELVLQHWRAEGIPIKKTARQPGERARCDLSVREV